MKIRVHWNFLAQRFKFIFHIKILKEYCFIPVLDRKEDGLPDQQECYVAAMAQAHIRSSQVMQMIQIGSEVCFSSSFKNATKM